ncbi:diguanylate cyclase domain-containing protein [Rhizobium herbae]|uniref:Diguanylate cyclase (GGDEF)-like protein/PAS domain S-box-containing protein n=1 Tax=Rhizobium herbae TaxID=508661 RepID=A0ABS4ERR2_9HYPH|nr:GGDEF domain-containing protein [Rhizobium herbae]MBP1860613.1 diguanylate cyclase (GGDEF)-like protein/PAS domain S-box-containing protein [Rhizobium herbae]
MAGQKAAASLMTPAEMVAEANIADQIQDLLQMSERLHGDLADGRDALKRATEERDHLLALINQVPDQLFVKDLDSRFLVANEAVVADKSFIATGKPVTVEELIGKTDFDLFAAPVAQEFRNIELQIMQSGQPMLSMTEHNAYADGRPKWVSMTKAPLRDRNGVITGLVGVAHDVTLRKEAEDRVRFMAHHDVLTGLPNRALLLDRLDQAILQAGESGRTVAIVFLDLDNFKWVNDTLGHHGGDTLLSIVSARVAVCLRATDTVARLGGDEFVILLPDPPQAIDRLIHLVERVRKCVAEPVEIAGRIFSVTTSLGVARFPLDGRGRDELLAKADAAMYRSKRMGRNMFSLAEA